MKESIAKEKDKYIRYLKDANLRMTAGREEVFRECMQTHGHFAAEELVKYCTQHKRKVSRATIYRSLRELREAGVIRETAFGDKHHHFEHVYDEKPHHHALCLRCHEFLQFPDLKEDEVYKPYLEKKGFKILGHEMHFYGICSKCQS